MLPPRKHGLRTPHRQPLPVLIVKFHEAELAQKQHELTLHQVELADQLSIIAAQNTLLDQISVPVIQIWDQILLLPLVGSIDSRRAAQAMESLLEAIARIGAQVLLLDITGVPMVDTSVASYLMRAIQASQLLGCQSILVGIRPEIAQTLVGLGINFSHITTRATLQNGLEYALKLLARSGNAAGTRQILAQRAGSAPMALDGALP